MANVNRDWMARWLDSVASGASTMSQRALLSIDARGGIEVAVEEAKARNVHLVQLEDDQGRMLVAASLQPFGTLY